MAPKLPDERTVERTEDKRDMDRILAHHRQLAAAEARLTQLIDESAREVEAERREDDR